MADLRLRSVLCIPIRISGQVGGVLYVDNRLQQQVFQEREKSLLIRWPTRPRVAIHNARTMEELRRKQAELEAAVDPGGPAQCRPQGAAAGATVELSQIREELSTSRRSFRVRSSKYDYKQIVGQSRRDARRAQSARQVHRQPRIRCW